MASAGFAAVDGLGGEIDVVAYREGPDKTNTVRLLPGLVHHPRVILRRGFTGDGSLFAWWRAVRDGHLDRRTVAIVLLDEQREPVARWVLRRAWPAKYEGPALAAGASEAAIESLELVHEGLELD